MTLAVWQEGDQWVGRCLEFDVASSGPSADEAVEETMDAVCSYLNALEEIGERERLFRDSDIKVYVHEPSQIPLSPLPRDLAGNRNVQVRSFEYQIAALA